MRIKGVVSRIFCSKPSGFKILVLEVNISQQIPQKYINPEFPASVSAAGVMKEADIGYVVEIDGEWEHRDSGRFWPWQVNDDHRYRTAAGQDWGGDGTGNTGEN